MKRSTATRQVERSVREFAARHADVEVFLVGGAVRDRILGRRTGDLDFAVSRAEQELAHHLEREGLGRAVRISSDASPFPVWRLSRFGLTVDIARFENADTIERDLARRDFTVNAIARNVLSRRVVDPCGGRADIVRRRIRMISARNLDDDPVRVLRGYRLAAALDFAIEKRTRAALRLRTNTLSAQARERVHAEIVRLFGSPKASGPIRWAVRDGAIAASLGLSPPRGAGTSPRLAVFDGLRRPDETRLSFRLGTMLFRWGVASRELPALLLPRGFSKREIAGIARNAKFLEAAFSTAAPERILFDVRNDWPELKALLRLAAQGSSETARARLLMATARRCRFDAAPVNGRDIALWLGVPPGKELGAELDRARFLYFTRSAPSRADVERAVRAFDRSRGVG